MPPDLPPWPALAAIRNVADEPLVVHRAVLGKVHQAASDFRWITHSEAIRPRKLDLDRKLSFGPEDRPVRTSAWRALADACVAVLGYRSRAVDRAGRSGGLEKQILYWPGPQPNRVAAGALALLGALEEASDEVWWDHWESYRWDEPDYFVPREPEEVRLERVESALEKGLSQLAAGCTERQLAQLYAELLSAPTARPAVLEELSEPLPPLALAALLLPFSPEEARRLSLAGGLPNSRHLPASLANWDGVVRTAEQPELTGDPRQPTAAEKDRGAAMAAAIRAGDPANLQPAAPASPTQKTAPPAEAPTPAIPEPEPVAAPEPPEASPPASEAPQRPTRLSLAAERFEEFLDGGAERRYLEAVPENSAVLTEEEGRYLLSKAADAVRELEPEARGDAPRARQLAAKIELIRAWMVSCFPRPEVEAELRPQRNQRIPPLLFAADIQPADWAQQSRLSPAELDKLVWACGPLKKGFTPAQWERFTNWRRDPALAARGKSRVGRARGS